MNEWKIEMMRQSEFSHSVTVLSVYKQELNAYNGSL